MFENKLFKGTFGQKRDEVTGEWRKLHNEEIRDLYSSPSTIKIMKSKRRRWAGYVVRIGERNVLYWLLARNPEGRRTLRRPRRIWMDDIHMDLGAIEWIGVDWICLA
jgi:hypothetical protein